MKSSHYLVKSELPNSNGDTIIFSTRTCKPLLVSKQVNDCLETGNIDNIPTSILDLLLKNKIVVSNQEDELKEIINENELAIEDTSVLFEVIQPTANCQLGCHYCGQEHTPQKLSENISSLIVKRIKSKLFFSTPKYLKIGWFGGEPLLGITAMRSVSKQLIDLCNETGVHYSGTIVTNGLSLKAPLFKELVEDLKISQIEITLDGYKDFHNQHRPTKKGNDTFDIIFSNLLSIIALKEKEGLKCDISIRCNVDKSNEEGVMPLIDYFAQVGLQKSIKFYTASIYSWGKNDAHTKSLSREDYAKKELFWNIELYKRGFASNLKLPKRKPIVCMAVNPNSEVYDAYGRLYNCTEIPYSPVYDNSDYILGQLDKTDIINKRSFSNWNQEILSKDELICHSCKFLPVCGGSCPKSWAEGNIPCPTNKLNLADKLKVLYSITAHQQ